MSADPEIRIDQLTGLRTILAPARAERPIEFVSERPAARAEDCPFCEGREDRTPPETWADRPGGGPADSPGWRVRAVPNLYPVVAEARERDEPDAETGFSASADPLRAAARGAEPDLFSSVPATGHHEVIIHSPQHRVSLAELTDEQRGAAVAGWRPRLGATPSGATTCWRSWPGSDRSASRY